MRDSLAGAWLYSLIMIFMVFMIGYVAVSINYNRTYQIKEDVVSVVEKYQGVNDYSIDGIKKILKNEGHTISMPCRKAVENQSFIGISQDTANPTMTDTLNSYQVCIKRDLFISASSNSGYTDYYYTVFMFFNFDLPLFGRIFNFTVSGQTNVIYYPLDTHAW